MVHYNLLRAAAVLTAMTVCTTHALAFSCPVPKPERMLESETVFEFEVTDVGRDEQGIPIFRGRVTEFFRGSGATDRTFQYVPVLMQPAAGQKLILNGQEESFGLACASP